MRALLLQPDAVLRSPARLPVTHVLALLVVCGAAYGAVMGSFGGFAPERLWQVLYSAVKVPLLLLAAFCISLPSFFVLNTLLGLREDFAEVLHAVVSAQGGLTVVLLALAPYTAFWYVSFAAYQPAILFNGAMFAVASLAGQWHLRRSYRPLTARQPRHRLLLRVWLLLYVFVGIQVAWVLRPFVGDPNLPPQFVRAGAWGNAYVVVIRLVWDVLTR
jgi:hypothetical protein